MSFADFFKKSPKKKNTEKFAAGSPGPQKRWVDDPTFFSPEYQEKRYNAALEFLKNLQERMPLAGGTPHAGTLLSVAARLAGTSLYRSMNYQNDAAPGVVVLSEEVNQAWPQLVNLFAFYCKQNGFDVMAKPTVTKFPEDDKPRLQVDQVLKEYQDQYHAVMQKHGLDYLNGARSGMVACSIIFQHHVTVAKNIDPFVATGIVTMGVIEGAKTTPPPLKSASR